MPHFLQAMPHSSFAISSFSTSSPPPPSPSPVVLICVVPPQLLARAQPAVNLSGKTVFAPTNAAFEVARMELGLTRVR